MNRSQQRQRRSILSVSSICLLFRNGRDIYFDARHRHRLLRFDDIQRRDLQRAFEADESYYIQHEYESVQESVVLAGFPVADAVRGLQERGTESETARIRRFVESVRT